MEPSEEAKMEEEAPRADQEFGITSMFNAMRPLLKSPTFLLISISGTITMMGFFGPYAFLVGNFNITCSFTLMCLILCFYYKTVGSNLFPDKAMKEIKVNERKATFLLSIVGISNTSSRLIFGLISCHPWVNSLILSNAALTIIGIAAMLIPFTTAYYQLVIFSIVFGIGLGNILKTSS